ncbi:MAG: aminotransferase class IV [Fervidobacterium sp.]
MFISKFQTNELIKTLTHGIAVYETIRTYNGKPFAMLEHYKRLKKSLSYLAIDPPKFSEFEELILESISHTLSNKAYIDQRIRIIYAYDGKLISYVSLEDLENIGEREADYVKIDITHIRRADPSSMPPDLKSLGRPDIYLARLTKGDNYDVIMLGSRGQVCEGTFSNLFLIKDRKIVTPSIESGILDGITRMYAIKFFKEIGWQVEERFVELKELYESDEAFLTHTSRGIVPVNSIGKIEKKSAELSREFSVRFEEYIKCLL